MALVAKFLNLRMSDRLLLTHCLCIIAIIRVGLYFLSYETLNRFLQKRLLGPATDGNDVGRIVWGVNNAARVVPRATCLTKAFAAQLLLARSGHQSHMRIGVDRDSEGQFIAHAWLISEGRVLIGGASRDLLRYTTLTDLHLPRL